MSSESLEEKEGGAVEVCKETIDENFPNLAKGVNL